jgi:hypothetical protein
MTEQERFDENDIAALAATVKAPDALHRRIEALVADDPRAAGKGRRATAAARDRRAIFAGPRARLGAAAAAVAILAAALVGVTLPGGGSSPLTVQRAVALTLSSPKSPAPAESRLDRSRLDVAVEGVSFPYWRERFGWVSAGARTDEVGGRSITTVFYTGPAGRRIGYAIVSGRALPTEGGRVVWHRGVRYRVTSQSGATVVTWPRGGHLCVVSGRGVSARTLLALAGWSGERTA